MVRAHRIDCDVRDRRTRLPHAATRSDHAVGTPSVTRPGDRAAEILLHGILDRAFPAAAIEVGRTNGPVWQRAFGTLTYDPESPHVTIDTVFDLASLTKVIATTTLA